MKIFIYANIIILLLIATTYMVFSTFYLIDESEIPQNIKDEYGDQNTNCQSKI